MIDKFTDSLSTGILLIDTESKVLVEEINLAAIEILGLDKKGLNTGELKTSHPNLANLLKEIKEKKLNLIEKPKKRIRSEIYTNGNYLNVYITQINISQFILELQKVTQKDIGKTTHELKRPIQNIKTLTETLLMGAKNDPINSEKFLKNINYEADRLGRLVNDLLRISSLQSGNVEIKKSKIKLKDLVESIIQSLEPKAKEKKVIFENKISENKTIEADRDLISHALENLIENAIKYNKENGNVVVEEGSKGELVISDTGLGIEREDLEKIFEQFYRTKKTENISGTGLGLSIVKSIVDLHNGNLSVESKPEIGSSFKIWLS